MKLTIWFKINGAGEQLPVQAVAGKLLAEVDVPACGWTDGRAWSCERQEWQAGESFLEKEWLRVDFNEQGEIVGIRDKETGRELTKGVCNRFKIYKDVTTCYDAWGY